MSDAELTAVTAEPSVPVADGTAITEPVDHGSGSAAPGHAPGHALDPGPSAPSPMSSILAGLSVAGLDLDRARQAVDLRAARRLRRRHVTMGGAAALVLVALTVVLWPRAEPRKVVTAGETTTSSTTTAPTTTTAAVVTTVAPTTVAPTTSAAVTTITTVPPTIATTTTAPPNLPVTVSSQLLGPNGQPTTSATAGDAVTLRVKWTDPDLADPSTVDVHVEFGDQLVTLPVTASRRPPCDTRGNGFSGQVDVPFRYSMVGTATIQVEVTSCDGAGAYGGRANQTISVPVVAPPAGRRIAVLAGVADGRSGDAGVVVTGAATTPKRSPEIPLVSKADSGPVTVASIPSTFAGLLSLTWVDPAPMQCQPSQTPLAAGADGSTVMVRLGALGTSCAAPPAQSERP